MTTPPGDAPTPVRAGPAVALLVAGTFFMENLDATVITPAVPSMADSFGVQPVDLNTGISAYMLTLGIFIPLSGWIADRYGARTVFATAIAAFTIASLFCGLATSLPEFVAMRVLQGIGAAMMVPVGRLVVLRATPKEGLITAIALLTWPALVAPVLGPPLGGLITEHADWRWIFFLNLPLGIVAFVLAWWIIPNERGEARRPFDWPGFLLSSGAFFCLLYVAELLGRAAIDWPRVALLAVAGLALLVIGVRHLRRASAPMIDLAALRFPTFAFSVRGGSVFRLGVSAVPFLLPLMFQIGFGYSPFEAGAMLMAVFAGNLAMKPMTTGVLRRFGFRRVLVVNGIVNATAIGACALLTPTMPIVVSGALLFIGGMARSMQFTALNTIAFADVPRPEMNGANTLFSAVFQLAMGLGVALGAIAWRIGQLLFDAEIYPAGPFRVAFLLVALLSLIGVWDSLMLAAKSGDHLAARRPRS